jgi:hypothetical protein
MKANRFIVAAAVAFSSLPALAADTLFFEVNVRKDGELIEKPAFLATVGQPVTIRLGSGLTFEAASEAAEKPGNYWSKIRITYFETPESRFVQEMTALHDADGGSFEYTDPAQRRYFVKVRKVDR